MTYLEDECQCGCGGKTSLVMTGGYRRFINGHQSRQARLLPAQSALGHRYKGNLLHGRAGDVTWYRPSGPRKAGQTMQVKALLRRMDEFASKRG